MTKRNAPDEGTLRARCARAQVQYIEPGGGCYAAELTSPRELTRKQTSVKRVKALETQCRRKENAKQSATPARAEKVAALGSAATPGSAAEPANPASAPARLTPATVISRGAIGSSPLGRSTLRQHRQALVAKLAELYAERAEVQRQLDQLPPDEAATNEVLLAVAAPLLAEEGQCRLPQACTVLPVPTVPARPLDRPVSLTLTVTPLDAVLAETKKALGSANQLAETRRKLLKRVRAQRDHAKRQMAEFRERLVELEKGTSRELAAVLQDEADKPLPAAQALLRPFIRNQLTCLSGKKGACKWHPIVLEWCASVWRCSRSAYDMLRDGGVVQLPSANHLRNREAASPGKTGQDIDLYCRVGKDLEVFPAKKRELNVVFDEVNTVGNVAFKLIKGKYRFFGIVDKPNPDRIFAPPPKKALTVEQQCQRLMASHALVFMAVVIFDTYQPDPAKPHFSPERVFRRVVGIHAVRDAVAEDIDELFWDTVANLKLYAGARVIYATCDGAGVNRLFQKYNASYQALLPDDPRWPEMTRDDPR